VPYAEVPAVMAALAAAPDVAAQAVRFLVLCASRLGECLKAVWSEVNLEATEPSWTIPESRMKMRREHRVPLSPQAMELLRSLYREDGNDFLFISTKTPGAHVSASTLTQALRRAGCKATLHGFRSCFKTWAEERTNFDRVIVELSLAHKVGDATEDSYRRGDGIEKRRRLMEAWARFCAAPAGDAGKVLPMRR
jgi:integrase